jgi:hypothetical protein
VLSTGADGIDRVDKFMMYDVPEPSAVNVPLKIGRAHV